MLSLLAVALIATLFTLTWRQSHMYRDLETLWKTTISRNPEAWLAYANLGAAQLDEGVHDLGVANLRAAIKIKPDYADPYNNLATFFHEQGRPEEAIPFYETTLELEPDHMAAHFNFATLLRQSGRTDEAIVHLRKVIAFKEGDADAHRELGLAFQQKGQLAEAIVEYERVAALRPSDADIQIDLGAALLASGKAAEAIDHFQKSLAMKPGNVLALNNLAFVLATGIPPSLRNGARAVELAEQARQLTRASDPTVLRTLAAAYASVGRVSDALPVAREALRLTEAMRNTAMAELLRREVAVYQSGRTPF
jgi:tetratricopeptide (TPR) repeat protein